VSGAVIVAYTVTPPPGFARRTIARLLLESPELALSPDTASAAHVADGPQAGTPQPAPRDLARRVLDRATAEILAGAAAPRRTSRTRFAAALALSLAFLGVIAGAFWGSVVELQAHVRLAVVRAERGWREVGRDLLELTPGDGLAEGTVLRLGSDRHHGSLLDGIDSLDAIGCFALTELGYGNNAVEMQTTATYDAAGDEWVIHTPGPLAQKYWITNGAVHAQWAVVFAQLRIGDARQVRHVLGQQRH
jgi:alkylation response protein AidB-like acyl-CoA dehydrogenase